MSLDIFLIFFYFLKVTRNLIMSHWNDSILRADFYVD